MFYAKSILLFLLFVSLVNCSQNKVIYNRTTGDREYLNTAIDAAEWIISTTENNPDKIWPDDNLKPEAYSFSVSSGVAGKVLFFLELYNSTNNKRYLDQAIKGGEYLLSIIPQNKERTDSLRNPHTFYGGLSGVGFTLRKLHDSTEDMKYADGEKAIVNLLKEISIEEHGRVNYGKYNDVLFGSTGTALYLLDYYKYYKLSSTLEFVKKIAAGLIERADKSEKGWVWKFREDKDFILPNFSHGNSGIGYFFAELFETTKDSVYLNTAIEAYNYLESIADTTNNSFLIPYGFPLEHWLGQYDIGWAHGGAGTARLYYKLWEVTNDYRYFEKLQKVADGLKQTGMPGLPSEVKFGEVEFYRDKRFGTASVADYFMNLFYINRKEENLNFAKLLIDDLIKKGTKKKNQFYWEMERYPFFPDGGKPAQFTGYFYGAAGYGLSLLKLDELINSDNQLSIKFPDDPFHFPFKTISYKSTDDLEITADLYSTKSKNNPMVILFHRSASSRGQYRQIAPRLQSEGYNVLAVDSRWGGRERASRLVDNKTGRKYGAYEVIDSYPQYRNKPKAWRERSWPMINDSYKDLQASVNWVTENNYGGKVFALGSSITSIYVLKLANEMRDKVDGVVSYSPGEYNDEDTTMVSRWAKEIKQPVLIASGQSDAEEEMTKPLFELIPSNDKVYFKAKQGFHGSSILNEDEKNWKSLLEFLNKYK